MRKIFFRASSVILVAALCSILWLYYTLTKPLNLQDEIEYSVQPGMVLSKVADDLQNKKIISSALALKLYARFMQQQNLIKAGEYQLSKDLSALDLLQKMIKGDVVRYSITFVEGWTFQQIKNEFKKHPKIRQTLAEKSESEILTLLNISEAHLEGMFFADTYQYIAGMSDADILKRAFDKLQKVLQEEWERRAADLPFKRSYEALILASIVEKETGLSDERAKVAGVFVKRLNIGMRLQSDPTVIYGLGGDYQGNLTKLHLKNYTPYNTYQISGLPPSPIAIVSKASLHAAMNPEEHNYLYFVGTPNGQHVFSKNYEEHKEAVRRYQLQSSVK